MTTGATGQLGLALPVQGELSGTWGNTVNNGITEYTNIAIAATLTLTNDGAVTLANTTGDASASNIVSTLTGAGTVTAQFAIVRVTGTLTTAKVVTGPSYSKTYTVVNDATGGIVTFKAAGQTGVSIAVGEGAIVYYNGTDYVKVATSTAGSGTVTAVSVASSNGFAGSSSGGATPALTLSTSITGVLKGNGTAISAASAGTDYLAPPSGTAILKANSGGALANATAGTDYVTPTGTETLTNKTIAYASNTLTGVANTSAAQTFTGGQRGAVTALTSSSASIAINLATNCNFSYTTTESSTLAAPSNAVAGQSGIITITQGATPYTLAYNTFYKFAGGTVPTLTATAGAVDIFAYYVESASRATCQLIKDVK